MFELPGGLRVIERRCIAGELKLLHQFLRAGVFALEQERQINFELNALRILILFAPRDRCQQCFEAIPCFAVFFSFKRNLREIVLRVARFRSAFSAFLKDVSAPSKSFAPLESARADSKSIPDLE